MPLALNTELSFHQLSNFLGQGQADARASSLVFLRIYLVVPIEDIWQVFSTNTDPTVFHLQNDRLWPFLLLV